MNKKLILFYILAGIIVLTGCTEDSTVMPSLLEDGTRAEAPHQESSPLRVDTLWFEGKQIIVTCDTTSQSPMTRGVGTPAGTEGPFEAPAPKLVQKGKYKTYFIKMSEFDWIPSYSYILMSMDKYAFTVTLPNNAQALSISLRPLTQEGFSTEAGGTKGYTLGYPVKTSKGFQIPVSFYIQCGAAYSLDGKQLCANREMPIAGTSVRYSYTYNLAE